MYYRIRGDEHHPREHRHAEHRHAGTAHVDDGDDQVDGTHQRREAGDLQTQRVEVDAVPRRERQAAVGRVVEPPAVRAFTEDPRRVQEDAAGEEDPKAQRVEPGKHDVAGTDLQRDEVVGERRGQRHGGEEDHRHAVHREDLVVQIARQQLAVGTRQLDADQQRFDAADEEEHRAPPRRT